MSQETSSGRAGKAGSGRRRVALVLAALFVYTLAGAGCVTVSGEPEPDVQAKISARRNLGIDHLRNKRTAMAIRELRFAEDLNPDDPDTLLWLGEAYRRKGLLDEAERYLRRSIKESRRVASYGSHDSMLNLAAMLIQRERYAESIEISEELIEDPTFSSPWRALTNRGWAELQLGDVDAARASFEAALEFSPRFGPALLNLGILETKAGRTLAALDAFKRALDSRLGFSAVAETNFRLGELYVSLGRRQEAISHFEAASESSPYDDWGTQAKSYLELLQ